MCTMEPRVVAYNRRLMFLADFHVKSRTWTNNTQVRGDAYKAMQVIGDYAEENEIEDLLIGGDFFDSNRPTAEDLVYTVDFLSRFKRVYYIRGNHDSCDPSYLEAISRILGRNKFVHELDIPLVYLCDKCYLAGISWMPSKEDYKAAVKNVIEYFKEQHPGERLFLMIHTSFQHLLSFDGAYTFETHEVAEWCKGVDVVLLVGDVHVRDTRKVAVFPPPEEHKGVLDNLGELIFHSPGSVYPLQFCDTDTEKFVTIIDPDAKSLEYMIQAVPVKVRDYECWLYKDQESLDKFLQLQAEEKKKHTDRLPTYIKIIVNEGVTPPHINPSDWPDFVIQIQINMEGPEVAATENETKDGTYTLEQAISEEFPDKDIAEIASKLVSVRDPADELRKYMEFWGVERTTL